MLNADMQSDQSVVSGRSECISLRSTIAKVMRSFAVTYECSLENWG